MIIGRNAKIWTRLTTYPALRNAIALGHKDVASFEGVAGDVVWILSYAREPAQNTALFRMLKKRLSADTRVLYVSTATANVAHFTGCYTYPRVKQLAEEDAEKILGATIVRIGLVHDVSEELPGGHSAVTSVTQLAEAIAGPPPQEALLRLYKMHSKPFGSHLESNAYRVYGALQRLVGRYPCMLRPLDVLLRTLGWRWYGYLYLSNRMIEAEA